MSTRSWSIFRRWSNIFLRVPPLKYTKYRMVQKNRLRSAADTCFLIGVFWVVVWRLLHKMALQLHTRHLRCPVFSQCTFHWRHAFNELKLGQCVDLDQQTLYNNILILTLSSYRVLLYYLSLSI